jgi:hypothetical protein
MIRTRSVLPSVYAVLLALFCLTVPASATQHLIRAGDNWELLQDHIKPGDELILMPGEHRPAVFDNLHGTPDQPIIIRTAHPKHFVTIQAELYGIRLRNPRHVRIQNVIIDGAELNGISIDGTPDEEDGESKQEPAGQVVLENVIVRNTGPRDLRHAFDLEFLDGVRIVNCRVEGCTGSGIELVACTNVVIDQCRFDGTQDLQPISGIRIRGGSDRVRIEKCIFDQTGQQGICIGGMTTIAGRFPPPIDENETRSLFEASRVNISRCIIHGGLCAFSFVHCDRATVRNCTIVRPRRVVVSIRREQEDQRFPVASGCSFGSNLIVWQPDDLTSIAHLGEGASVEGVNLEENLWWSPDLETTLESLGSFPGVAAFQQIIDVNPKLDDQFRPRNDAAKLFGAHAP